MQTVTLKRIAVGAPMAAAITGGLFVLMGGLVTPKDVVLNAPVFRPLDRVTMLEEEPTVVRGRRPQPERLHTADQPPPPPKLRLASSDIDLPTPQIQGAAPTELRVARLESSLVSTVAIDSRHAKPIRPPVPSYPSGMMTRGIEGNCDVRLDVDVRGKPYNIRATCTNDGFVREAERAVAKSEFVPQIIRGEAVEQRNVVYPISFTLE